MKKIIFVFLFLFIFTLFVPKASATTTDNVWGWAWSENIGWISFNNCTDPEGTTPGCSGVGYGVQISKDSATQGCLSGYAWSEHIGWISFNETTLPVGLTDQTSKNCLAQIEKEGTTLKIKGWAKAVAGGSAEAGGWDGWIKLNGPDASPEPYLNKIDSKTNEFRGYAWGSDVVGWVSYNSQDGGGSTYKVLTSYGLNTPPYVKPAEMTFSQDNCIGGGNISFYFKWKYYDDEDDAMNKYDFKIVELGQTDPVYSITIDPATADSGQEIGKGMSAIESGAPILEYNKTYQWSVKVYNENGESSWIISNNNIVMPAYPYPDVTDKWSFGSPRFTPGTKVGTINNAICYDADQNQVDCTSWLWTYDPRDPQKGQTATFYNPTPPEPPAEDSPIEAPITAKDPRLVFEKAANYRITLKAIDGAGKSCDFSRNVTASTLRYLEPDDPSILDFISQAFDYLQSQTQETTNWLASVRGLDF